MRAAIPLVLASMVILSQACGEDRQVVTLSNGEVKFVAELSPFRFSIENKDGRTVLQSAGAKDESHRSVNATYEEPYYRVQVLPGWDTYGGLAEGWRGGINATVVEQTATTMVFDIPGVSGDVRFSVALEGTKVTMVTKAQGTWTDGGQPWNKVSLAFDLPADEHFFGLGERFTSVDHRGLSLYAWPEEGGLGKGENTPRGPLNPVPNGPSMTYFPVPFFLSSKGYAAWMNTTRRTQVHFGSEREDAFRLEAYAPELTTVVYVHDDPKESLDDFSRDTGRPFVPAPWVFGPKKISGGLTLIDGVPEFRAFRDKKIPLTVIDDAAHFLPARFEVGHEEDLKGFAQLLHHWGYKLVGYYNPYVSLTLDGAKGDREYGIAHNLFLKDEKGNVGSAFLGSGGFQAVATIDLTNPEGVSWFQDLMRRALNLGYDGWMHDFGEYVQPTWKAHDGRTGAELHNAFPVLSAKAAHDLLVKERPDNFLFFVRAGYVGTAHYVPAVWGGDPEGTFDETQGLPALLRGGLNLGMTGVPMWGSDISGFKCLTDFPNDKEVYLRWVEVGAVSPFMEEETSCANPTGADKHKWNTFADEETTRIYAAMTRFHTRMQPYFMALSRDAHQSGIPMMRHPFLMFPKEPRVWGIEDAFFLGPSLYTTPVVRRGLTARKVFFPQGRYVDLDEGKLYVGPSETTVPVPLQKLPVFLVEGQLLPLLDPTIDTLAPATEPSVVTPETVKDRLDVVTALAPGSTASFVLFDGTKLTATRTGSPDESDALDAVDEARIGTCERCTLATAQGDIDRLRVSSNLATKTQVRFRGITLTSDGPVPRRIRWDVRAIR
ncbi:MAG: glycoside hydrolase family 31 protein [Polyangiaceae bacterium]|nr:glycoside hydrolase family 31 protein [Polyangiaceae bacterium]